MLRLDSGDQRHHPGLHCYYCYSAVAGIGVFGMDSVVAGAGAGAWAPSSIVGHAGPWLVAFGGPLG